ncbi:MAG: glycoside hydrolase family 31 protein [Lachnospiraceae bacterium]|nr:glycoside hydrolase family 31 protein [Lachnospiraceae bacterium]
MNFFKQEKNALVFQENGETLKLIPWGENGLRVLSSYLGEMDESCIALLPAEREGSITMDSLCATITNGNITAKCVVQEWGHALQISFYNEKGDLLLQEITNGGCLTLTPRQFKPLPGGAFRLKATFISNPAEKIYGMGQYQQERMNLKGCNLELAHRNSQASIPFYISSLGYGFLWHNAAVGEVHFGLNTTEWIAEQTKQLDYWICAGDNPAQIEEAYAGVTGTAPMMPEYGLGFWQCKLRYYNQEQVVHIAKEYAKRGIPLDVLVVDYYHWLRCGDWKFDPEYFPNPKEMVDELKKLGIETMVSFWPQVDYRSENHEEMRQQGLLVKSHNGLDIQMLFHGNNVFMDATNPRTRKYVWEKVKKNYYDLGIRTYWLDEAEPEFTGYDYSNYHFAAGPVAEVGNIYPREYARLFYEGLQGEGQKDVISLIRCAWVGSQRYGALVWSGDIFSRYDDFRKQICAGLHMGLAGIPWWTTDIGGFHGGDVNDPNFKELLIRWFQFGTFCPVMRIHGARVPSTPIVNKAGELREPTGADNEIWSFGEENEAIMTKYIKIRLDMKDYTRSLMQEAHEKGSPVLRTLFYEFPEDPVCWDIQDSYLYGPDLLIAPICYEHAMGRKVYLPAGASWTDAHDGKVYEGGQWIEADAPIDRIPVYLRNGAQDFLIGRI